MRWHKKSVLLNLGLQLTCGNIERINRQRKKIQVKITIAGSIWVTKNRTSGFPLFLRRWQENSLAKIFASEILCATAITIQEINEERLLWLPGHPAMCVFYMQISCTNAIICHTHTYFWLLWTWRCCWHKKRISRSTVQIRLNVSSI